MAGASTARPVPITWTPDPPQASRGGGGGAGLFRRAAVPSPPLAGVVAPGLIAEALTGLNTPRGQLARRSRGRRPPRRM